jgi:hypothetical protein
MRKFLLASALAFAAISPAMADTFTVDSYSQPNGAQDITFTLGPISKTVSAGEIDIHQNNPALDLLVWCLDVKDTLNIPYTYQVNTYTAGQNLPGLPAGGLDGSQLRQIASLMLRGLTLGGLDAAQDDAATQLAIWSVEYGSGISFSGLGTALQNRVNLELADSMVGGILDCPTCSLKVLSDAINAPNQALGLAVNAVPGPMAGAGLPGLLAACLGIWGLNRRRRSLA